MNRIFGIETEFGCLVDESLTSNYETIVEAVKDYIFFEQRLGLLDLHSRDEAFEPAFCGGFLINGARLYVDAVGSHEEYATPECASIFDLIAADRAGHRILQRALRELGLEQEVNFYCNGVDHFGGHTFGCHENYLVRSQDRFLNESLDMLYPFLVTRQIYSGSGRVGGHKLNFMGTRPNIRDLNRNPVDYIWVSNVYGVEPDVNVKFQLSQRADHILKTVASRVRFNRALVNPKWESFYSHEETTRLHLLFPEPNMMEYAFALRIGTTSIMLDLIEMQVIPAWIRLADPVETLRSVSRDETYRWMVQLESGKSISAIDLHRQYLELAQQLKGRDEETDWVLTEWQQTLDQLEADPMKLGDRLDWVAKKQMIEMFIESEGVSWDSDILHSLDLEYHNIDPAKSLFQPLIDDRKAKRVIQDRRIVTAMTEPPNNTRAFGRSKLVKHLVDTHAPVYWVDWDAVHLNRHTAVQLSNPFENYAEAAAEVINEGTI